MGNTSSSSGRGHHDDSVDFGSLIPQGVYTGQRDWNQGVVSQLICARKLAPFYRPLDDYDDSWDDDRILAARKELPESDVVVEHTSRIDAAPPTKPNLPSKRPQKEPTAARPDAAIYRGAVECPICFLYYPPNINHSRCCDHPICTECFVQIKRSEPTTTHLVSDPAACPYCVQEHFGVVYKPPPWRAGIGSEGSSPLWADTPKGSQQSIENSPYPTHKRRQKSFGADSPEVVTIDQIRPDWEAKLTAVKAAVTRRANRRIIMRQVGDRLIPVGVTSGRVHTLTPEELAQAAEGQSDNGGSRRSRRRQGGPAPQGLEQYIGMGGQDLEELMVMEAMRLSLLEHEEQQRKQAEEKKKSEAPADPGSGSEQATSPTTAESAATPSISRLSTNSSQSKRRSFLSSRSSSPSPPPNEGTSSSSWRKRSSNPNSYNTLNAALSASASTASAFITPTSTSDEPTSRSVEAVPTITVDIASSVRPVPTHQISTASVDSVTSTSNADDAYDNLPSSPESVVAHEPLLGSSGDPATPTKALTGSRDYFGEGSPSVA